MATFTYTPSWTSSAEVTPRILEATFGDGYEQATTNGINTSPRSLSLTFSNRTNTQADAIVAFFADNETATTPFDYTPIDTIAGRFKCRSHNRVHDTGVTNTVTCTFDEVYF